MSDTDPHDAPADKTDGPAAEAPGGSGSSSDADDQPDESGETGHLGGLAEDDLPDGA